MSIIVFDLEWNQSPTGKGDELEGLPFEIIEIGAVKLDENYREVERFHRLVRPQVYRRLHYRTRELLHVNMKELYASRPFTEVVTEFFRFCGPDPLFCTWGPADLPELQRNMAFYRYKSPLKRPLYYLDAQKLFSLEKEDGHLRRALSFAVDAMGLEESGAYHGALEDAVYTAEVLKHLNMEKYGVYVSVDYFRLPETKEEEIDLVFPEYSKHVSRLFASRDEALADKSLTALTCCGCRSLVWKKVKWFASGPKTYLGLVLCPRHGLVKGKLRVKKAADGRTYLIRTLKYTDDAGARAIIAKRDAAAAKKKNAQGKKPEAVKGKASLRRSFTKKSKTKE